jgi:hypothetical protein
MRPIISLQNWVTKVKPNINSFEVHPQLSTTGHPVDGVLVGAGEPGVISFNSMTNFQIPPDKL